MSQPSEPVIGELQKQYGLTYQIPYVFQAEELVGLRDKRVLEVGGSLPEGLVIGELGAAQWVGIEEVGYWDEHPSDTPLAHPLDARRPQLTSITDADRLGRHEVLLGAVEDLPLALCERFDVIFSIATFEHILKLPLALDRMFAALRPGGKLFTMFSPIWSAPNGHHLPAMVDRAGKRFTLNDSPIPPWGHLLLRPPQLFQYLLRHTDYETAGRMVYFVYHSPRLNRLFTEDFAAYIEATPFTIDALAPTFSVNVPPQVQADLQRAYPGRKHFANNGILAVLTKPASS